MKELAVGGGSFGAESGSGGNGNTDSDPAAGGLGRPALRCRNPPTVAALVREEATATAES